MLILEEIFGRELLFYTFEEFFAKRRLVKEIFEEKVPKDRYFITIYRMYVESRPWIKEYYRECIWDYLNGYMEEIQLASVYITYKNSLARRKKKMEKENEDNGEEDFND